MYCSNYGAVKGSSGPPEKASPAQAVIKDEIDDVKVLINTFYFIYTKFNIKNFHEI